MTNINKSYQGDECNNNENLVKHEKNPPKNELSNIFTDCTILRVSFSELHIILGNCKAGQSMINR